MPKRKFWLYPIYSQSAADVLPLILFPKTRLCSTYFPEVPTLCGPLAANCRQIPKNCQRQHWYSDCVDNRVVSPIGLRSHG